MSIIFCKTPEEVLQIKGSQKIRFFVKTVEKRLLEQLKAALSKDCQNCFVPNVYIQKPVYLDMDTEHLPNQ